MTRSLVLVSFLLLPLLGAQCQTAYSPAPKLATQPPDIEINFGDPSLAVGVVRNGSSLSIFNATPDELLMLAHGIPARRVRVSGQIGKAVYNMTVRAAAIYNPKTEAAVDEEIESVCGVKIERHTSIRDVYVLKASDNHKTLSFPTLPYTPEPAYPYQVGWLALDFRFATLDVVSDALEQVLNTPVVDESGVHGRLTASFKFQATDYEPVKDALEKSTGFTLIPARRPIEIITVTPMPDPYSSDSSH